MKSTNISNEDNSKYSKGHQYTVEDLYGYNPNNPQQAINIRVKRTPEEQKEANLLEIYKLAKSFPEVEEAIKSGKLNDFIMPRTPLANYKDELKDDPLFREEDSELNPQSKSKKRREREREKEKEEEDILKPTPSKGPQTVEEIMNEDEEEMFPGSIKSKLSKLNKMREGSKVAPQFEFAREDTSSESGTGQEWEEIHRQGKN
jgi:hypothetical protein